MPYIKPTSDIFIKYLFGKEEHSRTLIDFINAVQQNCGFPLIKSVKIKNPFNLKNLCDGKDSVLDIKAVCETGQILNIEVQTSGNHIFKNRSLYYWARLYSSQLELNPPPDFTTFLFYNIYAFFLITSKVPDARQQGSSTRSRIRHTSQGDAAAANAAGGIVWWIRDDTFS